jgi:hypothetical protein
MTARGRAKRIFKNIREDSPRETSDDPLVSFLYLLMRDHLPCGQIEAIMKEIPVQAPDEDSDCAVFSNGWLARHAKHLAARLRPL